MLRESYQRVASYDKSHFLKQELLLQLGVRFQRAVAAIPARTTETNVVMVPIRVSMVGGESLVVSRWCNQSATLSNKPPTVDTARSW